MKKNSLNKHIEHKMNDKKCQEEIVKMKMTYKKKIENLQQTLKDFEDKNKANDKYISKIKKEISEYESLKKIDPLKLEAFDYSLIRKLEK